MGMSARSSRLCHTPERKTGLDARNHHVSGTEPTIGLDLSERVEQVRAALPDTDRAWFDRDLDQAFEGGPVDPGSRAAWPCRRGLVAGGVRSPARRRPRRGCAMVLSLSGSVNRWAWRTRSAAISPELFPGSVRRRVAAAIRYHARRWRLMSVRCVGSLPASTARISAFNCRNGNLPP